MFIDASVIVAILLREGDHADLIRRIENTSSRQSSVVALFEAVLSVSKRFGIDTGCDAVERLVESFEIDILSVDASLLQPLAAAHARYGKGTGHPAKLNMGDCYSYAFAKRGGMPLLYEGDDFARTDLA
ncbi:MAG: type II toxin-antitoxin system VapC family toxin [Methylobacterium mesophilicum]|nr:type II toxin-antitoxin system VapC family toxin [Methylobacterium mesophilicum]